MALEFNKLAEQVIRMGAMVDKLDFDLEDRLKIARERFFAASDLDFVHERVALMRRADFSGYRGAAPLDPPYAQPVNLIVPPPTVPDNVTVLAADGSQIYPNERAPVHYYLLNIGLFIYHHGGYDIPEQITKPMLMFHKDHVHDQHQRVISNRTVDARRTVLEMQTLAETAWELKDRVDGPIVALFDNNLMFWANADVTGGRELYKAYHGALQMLHDIQANGTPLILAGYIDSPHRSSVMLRLLYLLSLADEEEIRANATFLAEGGDLEGLRDRHLFSSVLRPGERSAVMVQNSPRNLAYKELSPQREIAFFYIKVGTSAQSNIARVDIPMWVAQDSQALETLHAVLLAQSTLQGRNPYPYALTRADELAYVSGKDKAKLEEMINLELRRQGIDPLVMTAKLRGKVLARSDRQSYSLNTDLRNRDYPNS